MDTPAAGSGLGIVFTAMHGVGHRWCLRAFEKVCDEDDFFFFLFFFFFFLLSLSFLYFFLLQFSLPVQKIKKKNYKDFQFFFLRLTFL